MEESLMLLLLIYLLLTWPFRLVIKRTNDYNRAISLRKFCHVLLYVFVIIGVISVAIQLLLRGTNSSFYEFIGKGLVVLFFLPIYYLWAKSLLNYVDFYDETIIDRLQYFILYLRSFKDDKRRDAHEMRCMETMYNLFCPYAVGVPSEFSPSEGAPRIYIGEKWQEQVSRLFQKAPIVLFRISDTSNFLWEVEHCVDNNMLQKSLFWIGDKDYYCNFAALMQNKGYNLPPIENDHLNSILYFQNEEIKILPINTKKQRDQFVETYKSDKTNLLEPYTSYLFGRDKKLKLFISNKYSPELIPEVKSWSFLAFFFPAFYSIFHSFSYRTLIYLGILMLDIITGMSTLGAIALYKNGVWGSMMLCACASVLTIVFRLLLSYYMGRNAKSMVWLSEKWSSVEEYNYAQKRADRLTYFMVGVCLLVSALILIK